MGWITLGIVIVLIGLAEYVRARRRRRSGMIDSSSYLVAVRARERKREVAAARAAIRQYYNTKGKKVHDVDAQSVETEERSVPTTPES